MLHRADHRGETSAQVAVLAPALFGAVLTIVHVASLWSASHTAGAAAFRGARAASVADGGREAFENASRTVEQTVAELGSRIGAPPRVDFGDRDTTVSVTVRVDRIMPFLPDVVTRTVTMAREEFTRESER